MSWFKRKIKPSRKPEAFKPPQIEFFGEQVGPVEDDLKARFCAVFTRRTAVQSAYLARVSYGEPAGFSVALCLRSSAGIDHDLQKCIGEIFAETFRAEEHLDILFMREDQEVEIKKVCSAFYVQG